MKEEDGKGFWGIEDYNGMSWDRMAPRSPSILWDRDFEAEPTFGDADPLTGEDVKDKMGIVMITSRLWLLIPQTRNWSRSVVG